MELRELVERGVILRATVGSTVHGLHHGGQDDRDEMAVFVEPPGVPARAEAGPGAGRKLHPLEHWVERRSLRASVPGPGDLDLVAYNLRKYVRLALKGHPTVLLLLFVPARADSCRDRPRSRAAWPDRRRSSPSAPVAATAATSRGQRERLLGSRGPEAGQPARAGRGARLRHEVRDARAPARLPGHRAPRDRPGHAADAGAGALARDGRPPRRALVRRGHRRDRRGRGTSRRPRSRPPRFAKPAAGATPSSSSAYRRAGAGFEIAPVSGSRPALRGADSWRDGCYGA